MQIVEIRLPETRLLDEFLATAGNSLASFRYFAKRDKSVLADHLVTLIGMEGNEPAAYGHLDVDGNTTWLGICVAEKWVRKGLGRAMMQVLVERAAGRDVWLTVDEANVAARHLYEHFGFSMLKNQSGVVYMIRRQ